MFFRAEFCLDGFLDVKALLLVVVKGQLKSGGDVERKSFYKRCAFAWKTSWHLDLHALGRDDLPHREGYKVENQGPGDLVQLDVVDEQIIVGKTCGRCDWRSSYFSSWHLRKKLDVRDFRQCMSTP